MFEKALNRHPRALAGALLIGVLLAGLSAWKLSRGPALDLELRWDPEYLHLSLSNGQTLHAPRKEAGGALAVGAGLWHSPESLSSDTQRLVLDPGFQPEALEGRWAAAANVWSAGEGGLLKLTRRLGSTGSLTLRVLDARDFTLVVGDPGLQNGVVFVVRPAVNDLGWCLRKHGRNAALQSYGPLDELAPLVLRLASAELLAWSAAAALLILLAWGLARLLALLPSRPLRLPRTRGLPLLLAALALTASALSLRWGGQGLPHVSDEISSLFQARILASGRLAAPAPPMAAAFRMDHVVADAQGWRSKYPLLWPVLLSPFAALNLGWLAGPCFAALAVLLLFAFAKAAAGRAEALAAAGLLACSPQFLWLGGSYFNHAASLAAALLLLHGAWSAVEQRREGAWWLAALGGAALAAMRPYSAALLSLGVALWALLPSAGRGRAFKGLLVVAGAELLALGLSNHLGTGKFWLSPYQAYDALDRPGFGPALGSLPSWGSLGHDAVKGLANTALYLSDLRQRALGWPWSLGGGLLLLALVLRRGWQRLDSLLLLSAAALMLGHYFYWCGHLLTFGTFYWYEALACLLWLALRGAGRLAAALAGAGVPRPRAALGLLMAVFSAGALLHTVPQQAWALRSYAGVDSSLAEATAPLGERMRALVLVEDKAALDYHPAFALQAPFQDSRFVYARARGTQEDKALALYYPSRRVLRWDGKSLIPAGGAK